MPSSSNSITKSVSLDSTIYTTSIAPITPSSPKNNFRGNDDSFDYDTILDGDNIKWGVYLVDTEQRKAMPYYLYNLSLYSLSESLQSLIGQDDNVNISHNRLEVLSISSSNISEKDNIEQK